MLVIRCANSTTQITALIPPIYSADAILAFILIKLSHATSLCFRPVPDKMLRLLVFSIPSFFRNFWTNCCNNSFLYIIPFCQVGIMISPYA